MSRSCLLALILLSGCTYDWDRLRAGLARDARVDDIAPEDVPVTGTDVADERATDAGATDIVDVADARVTDVLDARAPDAVVADVVDATATDVTRDVTEDVLRDVTAPPDTGTAVPQCNGPLIDGVIMGDWSAATSVVSRSDVATAWMNNELRVLRVCHNRNGLYLGLEGTIERTNAFVVYIDRDFGSTAGIASFSALTDRMEALDTALSANYTLGAGATGFRPEVAWGTVGLQSVPATMTLPNVGFRVVWRSGSPAVSGDFAWQMGANTACAPSLGGACEVSIPWSALYDNVPVPATATLGIIARINSGDGTATAAQTIPPDPSPSRTIDRVLRVDVRTQ